jgi:hypothetical protein
MPPVSRTRCSANKDYMRSLVGRPSLVVFTFHTLLDCVNYSLFRWG